MAAPSLIQELGIVEQVASDIISFASGQEVSTTVDGYNVSVKVLASGVVAPYQTLSGSFLSILELAFEDYAAFVAGAPIYIAEKFGNTWYGVSVSKPPAVAASASASA